MAFPAIEDGTKAKKNFQVHSLGLLYGAFRAALAEHAKIMIELEKSDWTQVPSNINALIDLIEKSDTPSTMFRYPMPLDPATDK